MISRILLCIVPLLLGAVASGEPGELFPGKGRDPASQPEVRPIVVAPLPASQPAAKLPTSQPEVLTVAELVRRIPDAAWSPDAESLPLSMQLSKTFRGTILMLPKSGAIVRGQYIQYLLADRYPKAVKGRLEIDIRVTVAPGHKLQRSSPRMPINIVSLSRGANGSHLQIDCALP